MTRSDAVSGETAAHRPTAAAQDWQRAYTAYAPHVRRYLHPRLWQADDVEDLVQETFTRAMAWIHEYDPARGDLPAWLLGRVVPWVLADYGHARWRQRQVTAEATRQAKAKADTPTTDTPLRGGLADAVAALPTHQRRAVELIYLEGQRVNTSAAVLSRSRATVRFHRDHALHALRAALVQKQAS
jgi:RNA polymerase sigma factor (sigma-70 family)